MRIVAWLLVLAVLVAFLWFNQRGVPDFVKRPILAELKARGLDVEFHRLRWQWFRGLVAEGIVVGQAGVVTGPHFSVGEVEVQLDSEALRHFQLIPRGVVLSQGGMTWKLAPSNLPPQVLLVTNLATTVRFLPNDVWELPQLNATVQGIQMKFSAVLTNATALRRPGAKSASPPTGPAEPARPGAEAILHRVLTELARVQFTAPPEIELALRADAKLERGFQADLKVQTRDVVTPWGSGRHANFTAKINQPPGTNGAANADFRLEAERLRTTNLILSAEHVLFTARLNRQSDRTNDWDAAWEVALRTGKSPWAEAATLRFSGQAAPRPLAPDEWRASGTLRTTGLKSEWGQLAEGRLSGNASFAPARKQLLAADAEAQLTAPQTKWGTAKQARVTAKATHVGAATSPAGLESGASAAWGFWTNLAPWQLETSVALDAVQAPAQSLDVAKFNFTARWRAPELIVTNLHSELYQGALDTSARLDVATRTLMASGGFDFDAYRIEHLLDANTRREMSRFTFTGLPKARAAVALVLPEWTNSVKNWRATGESVTLAAHVDSPGGSYRNATYLEANTDLTLTNGILRLRNLWARRPEGEVHLNYDVNPRTKEFHWAGRAQVFPHAIEPLLERPEEKRILTNFTFTIPPSVEGEVWGRWGAKQELTFRAGATATNFILRGERLDKFRGHVNFTNQLFAISDVFARRGTGEIHVPKLAIDGRFERLWVTNATSTFDPYAFTRMIGPQTERAIKAYEFSNAPSVRVNGSIPFREGDTTDLHFDIAGGPFRWSFFHLPQVTGTIHWVTNRLAITNLDGAFNGGRLAGDLNFDFTPRHSADFGFNLAFTNASLPGFIANLTGKPNKLEGTVAGTIVVTNANTADWQSWQGFGEVRLNDGLLWEFPIFGLFSPVLNAINKDLGNSRAKEAKGTFILTNSVIYTKNLEINSSPARLHYDGTVDFAGRVNAVVEAEMFRDTFLVGPILSFLTSPMTKVFEYKVTGSLANPKSEPRFIPKFLLLPLRPFQTIREFLTPEKSTPENK
ncbi:MAG: hypothetical protein EBS84_01050 [Proteobacteria bacterium]|nr:hypothetical protein [Verrucomicrobiota bacterium]NBU07595.1 hypothetical protein [Pseudomonadota bacterium]